jgi:hypothetical protein
MAETLAFLQACAVNPGAGLGPSPAVDIGWHTFILHTKEYGEFCNRIAGRMIHHNPTDDTHEQVGKDGTIVDTLTAMHAASIPVDEELWQARAVDCSQCYAGCHDSP